MPKCEIKEIWKDCMAILLYRLNGVVLKATDNIVISIFLGLSLVGVYSNYYILYNTISSIFSRVFESALHSLGNLHTTGQYEHEYKIYKSINFISSILGATAGIGICCVANEFIEAWIGEKWVIPQPFPLLMGIEIYTLSARNYLGKYRNAMGLFQQAKYRPLFGMVINLILSIVLVKYWGICGVLVGTIVADWTTVMWYDPLIIHKFGFKNKFSIAHYYIRNLGYIFLTIAIGAIDYIICNKVCVGLGLISIIVHTLICAITVPIAFIINGIDTEETKYVLNLVKTQLSKIKRKKGVIS